jgi:hypothetical protein
MYVANSPRERSHEEHVDADRIGRHLVHSHGRRADEIAGLPLRALHELEHIEESMGLLDLQHSHTV